MPIDINSLRTDKGKIYISIYLLIGGDPQKVKETIKARFKDEKIVDEILELDDKWRKCKFNYILRSMYLKIFYSKI